MELSTRYSALVDAKLRNELVLKDGVIFNTYFEGTPKAGAVKIRKTGKAAVKDYDRVAGTELTSGASQWITVNVDKDKAVNEIVDGYEAAAIPDGVVADRLDAATYGIAEALDMDGAAALVEGGTALDSTAAYTKSNIYDGFVDVRKIMSEAGVPQNGRYALVSPETYTKALKSPEFIAASDLGDKVKATGALGAIAGFAIYESANLGENVETVFGHPNYATRIREWNIPVQVRPLQDSTHIGASAISGRTVYAHAVSNADAIYVKKNA